MATTIKRRLSHAKRPRVIIYDNETDKYVAEF